MSEMYFGAAPQENLKPTAAILWVIKIQQWSEDKSALVVFPGFSQTFLDIASDGDIRVLQIFSPVLQVWYWQLCQTLIGRHGTSISWSS